MFGKKKIKQCQSCGQTDDYVGNYTGMLRGDQKLALCEACHVEYHNTCSVDAVKKMAQSGSLKSPIAVLKNTAVLLPEYDQQIIPITGDLYIYREGLIYCGWTIPGDKVGKGAQILSNIAGILSLLACGIGWAGGNEKELAKKLKVAQKLYHDDKKRKSFEDQNVIENFKACTRGYAITNDMIKRISAFSFLGHISFSATEVYASNKVSNLAFKLSKDSYKSNKHNIKKYKSLIKSGDIKLSTRKTSIF